MIKVILIVFYVGFNAGRAQEMADEGAEPYVVVLNLLFGFFIWAYGFIKRLIKKKA